jgi:hypothetical protein
MRKVGTICRLGVWAILLLALVMGGQSLAEPAAAGERIAVVGGSEDVSAAQVLRISHPAYRMTNVWYSLRDPWNRDFTRLLMFENASFVHPAFGVKGRRLVWGEVGDLKAFGRKLQGLHWQDPGDLELLRVLLAEYQEVAKPVPAANELKSTSLYWSPFPGEESVLYGLKKNRDHVYRIDLDTGDVVPWVSIDPGDGTGISKARALGWTQDGNLIVNFNGEGEGGGFEVDVRGKTRRRYAALPDPCSAEGRRFPDLGHGHSSRSPRANFRAVNYGYVSDNGVVDLRTCAFIEDLAYETRDPEPYPHYTVYVSWKASESWFLVSSAQFRPEDPKPTPNWMAAPEVVSYALWQVYFDPGGKFSYREILQVQTANRWDPDGDHRNGNEVANYHAHLIPVLRRDGKQVWFIATSGEHSYDDYRQAGAEPWGTEGVFLADLEAGEAPGPSFADVPSDHWAYRYVEGLRGAGYVEGCSTAPAQYCPERTMTRAESAVFVVRGLRGVEERPPDPQEGIFADVGLAQWFAKWVHALWEEGLTAGCGGSPPNYCPDREHTRAEAAVFFVRMLRGPDYQPPEPLEQVYNDVPVGETAPWSSKWIMAAYQLGLVQGCESPAHAVPGSYRPAAPLTRAEAACMMVKAKGLQ